MKKIIGLLLLFAFLMATLAPAEAATGTLQVKVLGSLFKEPKKGVQVYLDYDKIIGTIKYTDAKGIANFSGLSTGTHKLKLWYNLIGFKSYTVTIRAGANSVIYYV